MKLGQLKEYLNGLSDDIEVMDVRIVFEKNDEWFKTDAHESSKTMVLPDDTEFSEYLDSFVLETE